MIPRCKVIGLDVVAVVAFATLGRRSHDEGLGVVGVVDTAAPFLLGLVLAWVVLRAWRRPTHLATGLGVAAITVVVGMVLRRTAFDEGTAASFVVVATLFLTTAMLGWRLVVVALDRRREPVTA